MKIANTHIEYINMLARHKYIKIVPLPPQRWERPYPDLYLHFKLKRVHMVIILTVVVAHGAAHFVIDNAPFRGGKR